MIVQGVVKPAPGLGFLLLRPALLKEKPRLPKKTGPRVGQSETLEVSGLTISPNPDRCIWFRALPDLCSGIESGRPVSSHLFEPSASYCVGRLVTSTPHVVLQREVNHEARSVRYR